MHDAPHCAWRQAAAAKPAAAGTPEAKLEKWQHPSKGWQTVESAARWTAGEWTKNMAALAKEACGEGERLACHFTGDASALLIFSDSSHGLRASTAGQLEGGVSLCRLLPHEMGWEPYARGGFRNVVGQKLWGEKAADVLPAGPDVDKINLLIVVKVQQAHLDDPERHVPGRDAIVILPRREPELTSADGHYWLPKAQVAKVYRLAGDDKALDIAVAKHMHDLAVAWSIDEAALAALTEFKGGELIVEGAEHLAFLWENGCLSKLATLDASGSRIGVEGGKALAPAIKASASLTSVSLDNSNLSGLWGKFEGSSRVTKGTYDATGINAIADALRVNASLTSLSMESNRIGAEGGVAIADALRVNASLTSVSLTNNKLCGLWSEFEGGSRVTKGTYDATGINAIADALRVNASLTSLRLNDNKLGPEGGKALAPGIAGSASLTEARAACTFARAACIFACACN